MSNRNSLSPDTGFFNYPQWNPLTLAGCFSRYNRAFYQAHGNNDTAVANFLSENPDVAASEQLKLKLGFFPQVVIPPYGKNFIPYWQAQNQYQALLDGLINLDANINDCIAWLISLGYSEKSASQNVCTLFAQYRAYMGWRPTRGRATWLWNMPDYLGGQNAYMIGALEPIQYIQTANNRKDSGQIVGSPPANLQNDYIDIEIGGEYVLCPCSPEVVDQVTKGLIAMGYNWAGLKAFGSSGGGGCIAANGYFGIAISLRFGEPRDTALGITDYTLDTLTRFDADRLLGQALTAQAIAGAKVLDVLYGQTDIISPIPIDPKLKAYLLATGEMNPLGHMPVYFQKFLQAMINGVNPMGKIGDPDIQAPDPLNTEGQPPTQIGFNNAFDELLFEINAGSMGAWAAMGGYRKMQWPGFTKTIPKVQDADGNPRASQYGALMLAFKKPGKEDNPQTADFIFPNFDDNEQWGDLAGAEKKGLCTLEQIANLFKYGVGSDYAYLDELILHPVPAIVAAFRAIPNGATTLDAYNAVYPKGS